MSVEETKADEARARRAAKRGGLIAWKSRARRNTFDNWGGFMLVNPDNWIVAGEHFEMSASDVIAYCAPDD